MVFVIGYFFSLVIINIGIFVIKNEIGDNIYANHFSVIENKNVDWFNWYIKVYRCLNEIYRDGKTLNNNNFICLLF